MPLFLFMLAPDAAAAAPAAQQNLTPLQKLFGNSWGPMFLLLFGVVYIMMIRPQQQKQKEHEQWQKRVGLGDEVVTSGGLVGKITHVADDVLTIEVGDKVRVRVLRSHVTGKSPGAVEKEKAEKNKASA